MADAHEEEWEDCECEQCGADEFRLMKLEVETKTRPRTKIKAICRNCLLEEENFLAWQIYSTEKTPSVIDKTIDVNKEANVSDMSARIETDGWQITLRSSVNIVNTFSPCPKPPKKKKKKRPSNLQQKFPKSVTIKDPAYIEWIRSLPCVVTGSRSVSDPHHVSEQGHGSMAGKTSDRRAIPLCHRLHVELHQTGRETFAKKYNLDYEFEIERLNKCWKENNSSS